jgi:DNA polymerase III subunit delta
MVAYKSSAVASFIKAPKPDCRAVLVYGRDAGLIAERADALAQVFARRGQGSSEIVRLDDRDFAENPARLEVELQTVPMFAEQSVVRVTAGAKLNVPALKALLAEDFANFLVVEGGNLRPDSALRKVFEGHASAAALPCYSDERGLSELIETELAKAGLNIDRETRDYLMARLGADQALSRAEVTKLALYAQGKGSVGQDDVEAIVGDAAETALENFVYATSGGDTKAALLELQRLVAAGTNKGAALSALGRHFIQLHRVAASVAGGRPAEEALRSLRPPPRPRSREEAFLARCRKWGAGRLAKALPVIQEAVRRSRRSPDLESAFAERVVLTLTSRV